MMGRTKADLKKQYLKSCKKFSEMLTYAGLREALNDVNQEIKWQKELQ